MGAVSAGTTRPTRAAKFVLASAALAGIVHGGFSLYWGVGGDVLVTTLGDRIVTAFADRRWLLIPVAVVKIGFALLALTLPTWRRAARLIRALCWSGAVALVAWGGANTLIGNAVLSGIIQPGNGYDRDGMAGHAWLWDPLFLLWGILVVAGLLLTRTPRGRPRAQPAGS